MLLDMVPCPRFMVGVYHAEMQERGCSVPLLRANSAANKIRRPDHSEAAGLVEETRKRKRTIKHPSLPKDFLLCEII